MDTVDCAIACHVDPMKPAGHITLLSGGTNANSHGMRAEFFGKSCHAHSQEKGVDAIRMAVQAYMGMELMLYPVYDQQYPDSGQIGAWAKPSLYWSIINGIYCGESAVEIGS